MKQITRIIKDDRSKLSWRHGVFAVFWVVTVIPGIILFFASVCNDVLNVWFSGVRRWANHDAYGWRRNYDHADEESVTWPAPPDFNPDESLVKYV